MKRYLILIAIFVAGAYFGKPIIDNLLKGLKKPQIPNSPYTYDEAGNAIVAPKPKL